MTDDEAFIRAIVDAPGDDLPRLVYADWLDDRDDPRGPYLRAEREAVESGNVSRLRELATGLDPVWVARVSRPPVGVCIERAEIRDCGPRLNAVDIDAAARVLGVPLSAHYRAFLLNYNGGTLTSRVESVNGIAFYPFVRKPKQGTFADLWSIYRQYRTDYLGRSFAADEQPWHWNYLPIGQLEGAAELCLGTTAATTGNVYALVHNLTYNPRDAHELANSLGDFLEPAIRRDTFT